MWCGVTPPSYPCSFEQQIQAKEIEAKEVQQGESSEKEALVTEFVSPSNRVCVVVCERLCVRVRVYVCMCVCV